MPNKRTLSWLALITAGLLEIIWAYFLKLSHGFSVFWPTIIVLLCLTLSFFLLGKCIDTFGIGLTYAVFTGIGIAGTTLVGILLLDESISIAKLISLILLLSGLIGLKLTDKSAPTTPQKDGEDS